MGRYVPEQPLFYGHYNERSCFSFGKLCPTILSTSVVHLVNYYYFSFNSVCFFAFEILPLTFPPHVCNNENNVTTLNGIAPQQQWNVYIQQST